MLEITCHGAVREIGGNKILVEDGGSAIMLDFGRSMGAFGRYFDEFLQPRTNSCLRDMLSLGLIPAIPGIYRADLLNHAGAWNEISGDGLPESARRLFTSNLESYADYVAREEKPRLHGILLSHAHADHANDLFAVDPAIPVYCTGATAAILKAVQDTGKGRFDADIRACKIRTVSTCSDKSTFPGETVIDSKGNVCERPICIIEPFQPVTIGAFTVEAVPVDHSVPGACGYVVTCPSGKTIFYTGDVRFHGRSSEITRLLRDRVRGLAPDVLITEGTRIADKDGRVTSAGDDELDVERKITEMVKACSGLAVVDFGWKDTSRFQTILNVAKATGRKVAVNPKVAYLWKMLAQDDPADYPDLAQSESVVVYVERCDSMTYSLADYSNSKHTAGLCVDWGDRSSEMKAAFKMGDEEYLASRLCHYRDGVRAYDVAADPSKYILQAGFFDMNELFDVAPPAGSIYVSASTEPFCDEMVMDERKLSNWLEHFGLADASAKGIEHHHVSGHANGEDLLALIREMAPKTVIPIHTERPEVFERELAGDCDVRLPEVGKTITL